MRALVIGAGVAGIVAAMRLDEQGLDVVVVEKADRVGGTWRENTYPGIACDVPSHLYSYTFAPNPGWSRTFAPGAEIQAYLEGVAASTGVDRRIRYGVEVDSLAWDGRAWLAISTGGDTFEAEVVVAATGVLHHPRHPDIEGLDVFAGACFHSARWDHAVDIRGARLGVIGTGSSGVQIIGAVVDQVAELHVFQRTAQWVMPMPNRTFTDEDRASWARDPELLAGRRPYYEERFGGAFADVVVDASSPMLDVMEAMCRANLEEHIVDPVLRAKLQPDYRVACKRLVLAPGFYESVAKSNVSVVVEKIARAVPGGLETVDGAVHELDVLVLATGFRVDAFLRPMTVRGAGGAALDAVWAERPTAYLGVSVPGFPNLFLINGPNGPVGNFSLIEVSELQVGFVLQLLDHARDHGGAIVASAAACERFEAERVEAAQHTVWATGCRSWYLDDRGVPAAWPWPVSRFRERMAAPVFDDFEVVPLG